MKTSIKPVTGLASGLLVAALCGLLAGCGGNDAADPGREQALALSRPGELAQVVQAKLRERQAQWQATPGAALDGMPATVAVAAPAPTATAAAAAQRSGPLAQEQGVDEADLLQTDGSSLYNLQPTADGLRLQVHARAADGRATPLATLALPGQALDAAGSGMHLSADGHTLALIHPAWVPLAAADLCPSEVCASVAMTMPGMWGSRVEIQRVDVSTPAAPAAGDRLSIDGSLVDSRRIGDALVVVTVHRPWLAAEALPAGSAAREAAIAGLSAADVLPRVRRNGGSPEALLADTDCYVQSSNASLAIEITTITVLDLRSPGLARSSRCFLGGTEALYMTPSSLYLATTRYAYLPLATTWFYPAEIKTDLHKFALAAGGVQYRGSGQVKGHLGWDAQRKSYRLSEHNGDLRVLSFTGSTGWMMLAQDAGASGTPPSPALLTVLRERASDQSLQVLATLPNANRPAALGKAGEQVYGVRFVGTRGYVVTFRRMDPLYVLDLADPADPRVAGELDLAGFSESLYPLDNGLLLGVGRDADTQGGVTALKLALFDVGDPARPALLASSRFGGAASNSALDYSRHGLDLLVTGGVARIALPVNLAPDVPDPWASVWEHGLHRFEVDTRARTLVARSMLGATSGDSRHATWMERSVQIGGQVYYLGSGTLAGYDW